VPTIKKTIEKVEGFANLSKGWRFGKGDAIDQEKRFFAVRLLEYASQYEITRANVFALADGGLLISFYIGKHTLDLTLEADGTLTTAEDFEDEQVSFLDKLCLTDAYDKIWEFNQNTLESSIQTTTNQNSEDLRVLLFPRHQATTAFPSFRPVVQLKPVEQSVSTFQITIHNLQECRQSSGMSR
jgi:hypothetical protein